MKKDRVKEERTKFSADTSGRSPADWARALLVLLLGLTIAHLGVTLFLLSELGTDTFTVFIQGLSVLSGLTVGTVHVIVLCILRVVMLLTTKGYVKPGTVVCASLYLAAGRIYQWRVCHGRADCKHAGRLCDPCAGNVHCDQQQCRYGAQ